MRLSTSSSERLTAADRPGVAQPVPIRDVPARPWAHIFVVGLLLVIALTAGWEFYWRAYGAIPGIRDDEALWARERRRVDEGEGNASVFIGSSRTFFDLQPSVWERLSGRRPIQLAINGTSPLSPLEDLANDPLFTGRLLIGVAPDLFFSGSEHHKGLVHYFHKESPSQRVAKVLSMHLVEPWLAFYDPDFALFTVLRRQPWPERKGLAGLAVRKLQITDAGRGSYMWSKLETDSAYRDLARSIWAEDFNDPPPTPAEALEKKRIMDQQIARSSAAIARLQARNVPVIFVRDPSRDDYLAFENSNFPRHSSWDILLDKSKAPGIYFEDYPQLQGYELPEWSHMTRASAERYTEALYKLLESKYPVPDHW
jgi:hypothetical protein